MAAHLASQRATLRRWHDNESAAILFAHSPGNQSTRSQPVENARQGGPFMGQAAMKIGYAGRRGMRKQRQDVRFALRQRTLTQLTEIKSDAMGRPLNRMNEMQSHE